MSRSKLSFGIIGIAGAAVFLVLAVISIIGHDSFSILNGFVSELGKYPASYLEPSIALAFNIGLAVSGLLFSVFMIGFGIQKDTPMFVATSFFGVLTGVLIAAQAIFTLNFASVHYTFTILLFASAFVTCALFIVSSLLADKREQISLATILVAFAAGVTSVIFAVFIQVGNMPQIVSVPFATRVSAIPFAMLEWVALLLLFAFVTLICVKRLINKTQHLQRTPDVKTPKAPKLKMPKFNVRKSGDRNVEF